MKKRDFKIKMLAFLMVINFIMILCLQALITDMNSKIERLGSDLSNLSLSEVTILQSDSEKITAGASYQSPLVYENGNTVIKSENKGNTKEMESGSQGSLQDSDSDTTLSIAASDETTAAFESTENLKLSDEPFAADSYAAQNLAISLKSPIDYSDAEVINQVWQLAQNSTLYAEIYEKRDIYPYGMLKNMVNNPELTSYVYHFEGVTSKATDGLTDAEKNAKFPLFLQWDERWGYVTYGNNMIGIAGCGPTCLSMVLFSLTRDETLTPDYCASFAMEKGHYLAGTGTMWSLFEKGPQSFGVKSEKITADSQTITDALNSGKMLVFSVGPGNFTAYGHFIVVYGMDEDGMLLVNDPNSVYRSTQHWNFDSIKGQIKGAWSFWTE